MLWQDCTLGLLQACLILCGALKNVEDGSLCSVVKFVTFGPGQILA